MISKHRFIPVTLSLALGFAACSGPAPGEDVGTASDAVELSVYRAELTPTDDAKVQGGAKDANYPSSQLWINTEAGHYSYVKFDLSELPPDATIQSARFVLRYSGNYPGERTVELGRIEAAWDENTVTFGDEIAITWGGPTATVDGDTASDVSWDVTDIVTNWQNGSRLNEGLALRGQGNGPGKLFHSKETSSEYPPRLLIEYTAPLETGPVPDVGDAADSTNHHGVVNLAYPGVPGQFPTVWNMAGVAGPRHANPTLWGFLGTAITQENDADLPPDSDGITNILFTPGAALSPTESDNDDGDEGWLNPDRLFVDCQRETLQVRVARAVNQSGPMYLNVWEDGTHDGDFADALPCTPPSGGAQVMSYEWILQDQVINMNAIPVGGFVDLSFDTERVLNTSFGANRWVRFTLSESPAVVPPAGGLPDGRGKARAIDPDGFKYGETEDYLYEVPLGAGGDLVLEKRVVSNEEPVEQGGTATFQIRLQHVGGTTPIQASIRDRLPLPLAEMHVIGPVDVLGTPSGAGPLGAIVGFDPNTGAHGVAWNGLLAPDSEVTLEFRVHVHVDCLPIASTKNVTNVAEARTDGQSVTAEAAFLADCPGELAPVPNELPIDPNQFPVYLP